MGTLSRLVSAALVLMTSPARADDVARWGSMINEASMRFGIPASWIEGVMRAESRGLTMLDGRPIRSRAGAMGLMQLMPQTWTAMHARLALGSNPDDPHDNILAGTCYLRLMYDRFGYPGLFGAYNAGPGAYAAWLAGTRRLPAETMAYLGSVAGTSVFPLQSFQSSPPPSLFVVRRTASGDQSTTAIGNQQASLFAVRKVGP
jgi:soluble lytic murein transglycosylase-like protein